MRRSAIAVLSLCEIDPSLNPGAKMGFDKPSIRVLEDVRVVHIPIVRKGDTSYPSSVICYTRQGTASIIRDFQERPQSDESRVYFSPGERVSVNVTGSTIKWVLYFIILSKMSLYIHIQHTMESVM